MDLREMTQNENRHPWELSRTKKLLHVFREFVPQKQIVKIADIGAGDRYFDRQLIKELTKENISLIVYAVDHEYDNYISNEQGIIMFKDIQMLKKNSMDCIIMMDVLEHIPEDNKFLKSVLDKLTENGILIVTVPAFQSLYSSHDTYLKHYRRYDYSRLQKLLLANKLQILRSHYFYTSLYMARWLQLKLMKNKPEDKNVGIGMWKYSYRNCITKGIELILNIDFSANIFLNKQGIRLPGLSLLAIASKEVAGIK